MKREQSAMMMALALWAAGVGAEEVAPESLPAELGIEQACSLALEHNPGLAATRERLVEQDGLLTEARARFFPRLTASGDYEAFDEGRLQSFGGFSPESTRWDASLDATLTVFSGGRNRQFIQGAKAHRRSIETSVRAGAEDLLIQVLRAYHGAWLADQRVRVQQEALSVYEQPLTIARNMFKAGAGEKYDVMQAEVALANARPPLIRAENDRRRSVDRLQEIVGLPYPPGQDASATLLSSAPAAKPTARELDEAIDMALQNRPEIERTEHDLAAARSKVRMVKREQSPLVDLFAGYGVESDQYGTASSLEGWRAGVKVEWPWFDGGARRGKVRQARSSERQIALGGAATALMIEGEVRQSYYDQQEAAAILAASETVITQAREALEMARSRYKAGKGTQLEVLESQLQLTRAQLEQSTARHDLELAAAQMKRATGESLIVQAD